MCIENTLRHQIIDKKNYDKKLAKKIFYISVHTLTVECGLYCLNLQVLRSENA